MGKQWPTPTIFCVSFCPGKVIETGFFTIEASHFYRQVGRLLSLQHLYSELNGDVVHTPRAFCLAKYFTLIKLVPLFFPKPKKNKDSNRKSVDSKNVFSVFYEKHRNTETAVFTDLLRKTSNGDNFVILEVFT